MRDRGQKVTALRQRFQGQGKALRQYGPEILSVWVEAHAAVCRAFGNPLRRSNDALSRGPSGVFPHRRRAGTTAYFAGAEASFWGAGFGGGAYFGSSASFSRRARRTPAFCNCSLAIGSRASM